MEKVICVERRMENSRRAHFNLPGDWRPRVIVCLNMTGSRGGGSSGHDGYAPRFDARIESHQLIGNLPTSAWPAGADFYFEGHAVAPITSCEAVKTCWFGDIGLGDYFELP